MMRDKIQHLAENFMYSQVAMAGWRKALEEKPYLTHESWYHHGYTAWRAIEDMFILAAEVLEECDGSGR